MFKLIEILGGVLIVWWLGFIFIASDPNVRIDRACAPVDMVFGRVTSSATELADANSTEDVQGWFSKVAYGCKYMVWNQFYGDEWRVHQHKDENRDAEVATEVGIDGRPVSALPVRKPSAVVTAKQDGVPPPAQTPTVRESTVVAPPVTPPSANAAKTLDQYKLPEKRAQGEVLNTPIPR